MLRWVDMCFVHSGPFSRRSISMFEVACQFQACKIYACASSEQALNGTHCAAVGERGREVIGCAGWDVGGVGWRAEGGAGVNQYCGEQL